MRGLLIVGAVLLAVGLGACGGKSPSEKFDDQMKKADQIKQKADAQFDKQSSAADDKTDAALVTTNASDALGYCAEKIKASIGKGRAPSASDHEAVRKLVLAAKAAVEDNPDLRVDGVNGEQSIGDFLRERAHDFRGCDSAAAAKLKQYADQAG